MDLRQVRYFVAVYEEGSFSRAAMRERCTQPGISVQVQKLEGLLGQRLFERLARGVVPTLAGRHFYACCLDVLAGLRTARQRMLDLAGSVGGRLRIGLAPTLCLSALPRALPGYLADHPYVELSLAEAFSGTLTRWVVDGTLDVALVTEPPQHLGLTTTPFFRDELVLVSRPRRGGEPPRRRRWSELRALSLVVPSDQHGLRRIVTTALGPTGGRGRTVEIDGMLATLELVRASDWVAVMPICAVLDQVARGDLTAERFEGSVVSLDFYLVHGSVEPVSVAAQRLVDALRSAAEGMSMEWQAMLYRLQPRRRPKPGSQAPVPRRRRGKNALNV
jgi:DNA-binding transcriptional LysR family regulator